MNDTSQKLSIVEKVGYSLGDLAANLVFQTLVTFIAFFYTEIYNIPPASAALIIFAGGMAGSFFNPIMGAIADRTNTRWGKFRPWLLWTAIPFGVIAVLAFSTPDFSPEGKIIYALSTYFILMIVYSANNLPYAALSGVLTGSMKERNSLSSYRFVAVMIAQFIIQVLMLPLMLILGDGDQAAGFTKVMTIFAISGSVLFIITFLTTKERIVPTIEQKSSVWQDLKDLCKNKPWICVLSVMILLFINIALKGGAYVFYFRYYADEAQLAYFLQNIGFNGFIQGLNQLLNSLGFVDFKWPEDAPTSAYSLFNACGIILMIVGIGFSKPLADRFGKRNVFTVALFISTIFLFIFIFFTPKSVMAMFVSQILHGLTYGVTIPLLWAMIADVADYSEWKNNRRATAIIFSAMIFGLKAGLSIGGALVAAVLAGYGFDSALEQQSPETIQGIKLTVSVFCTTPFFIAIAIMFFYEINKDMETRIEQDLEQRRLAS